jgi:hypothetical protein
MEYVDDHGTYADIPVDEIVIGWAKIYGKHRVQAWIEGYENADLNPGRNFDDEEIL